MKIITVDNRFKEESESSSSKGPSFSFRPDSCLIVKNRPVYISTYLGKLTISPSIVYRVDKLGKSISSKFAYRYYNDVAFGILFSAPELKERAVREGFSTAISEGFDNSTSISRFKPHEEFENSNIEIVLKINDDIKFDYSIGNLKYDITSIICETSKVVTLKTGDIIFAGSPDKDIEVNIGDRVKGYLNGEKFTDFTVK